MSVDVEPVRLPTAAARGGAGVRLDFLKLWGGQTASMLGTQVGLVALPLTAAVHLGAGPGQMGLLTAAGTAPYLLLGLPAGVRIDRRRRRPVMIGADLARAALLAAIPLLAVAGALTVELLIAIALAMGTCTMLFELAYPSYLPTLVGREGLVAAHARLSASRSTSGARWPTACGRRGATGCSGRAPAPPGRTTCAGVPSRPCSCSTSCATSG